MPSPRRSGCRRSSFPCRCRTHGWRFGRGGRSEEHTSELQSLMRTSYAVLCLKKKKVQSNQTPYLNKKPRNERHARDQVLTTVTQQNHNDMRYIQQLTSTTPQTTANGTRNTASQKIKIRTTHKTTTITT